MHASIAGRCALLAAVQSQFRPLSTKVPELWAAAIKLRERDKILEVHFSSGERFTFPAEYLRVESPSAEAQDARGRPRVVAGRREVGIIDVERIGSYAVRLTFDDLHSSGIYTWQYLHDLGTQKLSRMRRYLSVLKQRGLSRSPKRRSAASSIAHPRQPAAPPVTTGASSSEDGSAGTRKQPAVLSISSSSSSGAPD
ncbi:hypothetical protein ACK3TF_005962 [Chlorella vulgaris]